MGTVYKIRCRHCGAQFDHYVNSAAGVLPRCVGLGDFVETELAIRCPSCHRKMNNTAEEFNGQVEVICVWDSCKK